MGFFDRMANLGKGVGKVWARNAKEAFDRLQSGAEDWDDDGDPTADPTERKLRLLSAMRDEGLLSEAEYRQKRAGVVGLSPSTPKTPVAAQDDAPADKPEPETKKDKPRKRNL